MNLPFSLVYTHFAMSYLVRVLYVFLNLSIAFIIPEIQGKYEE
jgi:hypothetical protein